MAAAWSMDIEVARSGAQQVTLLFQDISGAGVDLTGVSVAIEFAFSGCTDPIFTAGLETDGSVTGLTMTDAVNGQALLTIYGSDFDMVDCNCRPESLTYKVILTAAGEPPLLVYGPLKLITE